MEHDTSDALTVTLFVAAALHACLILGLGFLPGTSTTTVPPSLEVILVQESLSEAPDVADYIAQVSQDGGGRSEDDSRPASPFASAVDLDTDGVAPNPVVESAPAPSEAAAEDVLTAVFSDEEVARDTDSTDSTEDDAREDDVVVEQNLDIARLTAEIDRRQESFAKRPKKKVISARTREAAAAQYMKYWVEKVERVGNLNFPDAARRDRLSGSLILTVGIWKNGEIEGIRIAESSGQRVLDDAARRTVELAGPFQPLQGDLAEQADILYIVRTWEFLGGDTVTTY